MIGKGWLVLYDYNYGLGSAGHFSGNSLFKRGFSQGFSFGLGDIAAGYNSRYYIRFTILKLINPGYMCYCNTVARLIKEVVEGFFRSAGKSVC